MMEGIIYLLIITRLGACIYNYSARSWRLHICKVEFVLGDNKTSIPGTGFGMAS